MTTHDPPDDFAAWIAENPPPSLERLITDHGTYWEIPRSAWEAYLRDMRDWQERRLSRNAA